MYQFADNNINEYGIGNFVLVNDGKPFEVPNKQVANALLSRGIIKLAIGIGKEIAKDIAENAIDKVADKATQAVDKTAKK